MASNRNKKSPVVVANFDVLDAEWAAHIEHGSLNDTSREAYAKRWKVWEQHCRDEGVDVWDAPASAFDSLWLLRRDSDGELCSLDFVQGVAGAVAHFYRKKDLTPAYKLAANNGRWRDLRRGRKRLHAQDRSFKKAAVVPMMRTDAQKLLAAPMPACRPVPKAALLLLLEGFAPGVIDHLSAADIDLAEKVEGGVVVCGKQLACDHRERVRGVPWDCVACAVRDAVGELEPAECFATGLINKGSERRSRFRHLADAGEPWGPRPGLTPWEGAGLRRAVVLSTAGSKGEGYRWARARAWVGVAWSCGLRMASDTDRLERADVAPDGAGRGWAVRLAATKDDQAAAKGVVRPFGWDDGGGVVAAALAEYACIRDALIGETGRFLVGLGTKAHGKPFQTPLSTVSRPGLDGDIETWRNRVDGSAA